jgi:chromosomal replication initiation ATPase DnaA
MSACSGNDVIIHLVLLQHQPLAKKVSLYLCHCYSNARLKEIGSRFGLGESALTQASRRLAERIEKDKGLIEVLGKLKMMTGS